VTRRRALALALTIAMGGGLAALVATAQRPDPTDAIAMSGPMPELAETAMNDTGRVDRSLYGGKVVLVNFWANWCGPCRREQPGLSRLWEEYRDGPVQFIGVNFRDDEAAAHAYLDEFDVAYPSVADPTGVVAHRFGVPYLPATILVGADGQMRVRLVGAQTESALREHLEELLAEAGPRP
jgi:thiol-disulfide isomerase/thioredoxin